MQQNNPNPLQTLLALCTSACTNPNTQQKNKSIQILSNMYIQNEITPQFLYQLIVGNNNYINDSNSWDVVVFVLMELLHDLVQVLEEKWRYKVVEKGRGNGIGVEGYLRAIGAALSQLFGGIGMYFRVFNGKKQIIKGFVIKSIKRTYSKICKHLLIELAPISTFFPIHSSISTLLPTSSSTLSPPQKLKLFIILQQTLSFLQKMSEPESSVDYIKTRLAIREFQEEIIMLLIKILPFLVNSLDSQIQVMELQGRLEDGLGFGNKSGEGSNFQKRGKMEEIEFMLRIVQAVLFFPYLTEIGRIRSYPHRNRNIQQMDSFLDGKQCSTYQYPKKVAQLIGSSTFIESLFNITQKILTYIRPLLFPTTPTPSVHHNLPTYLFYFQKTMQLVSQIAKTKLPHFHISTSYYEYQTHQFSNKKKNVNKNENQNNDISEVSINTQEFYQMFTSSIMKRCLKLLKGDFEGMWVMLERIDGAVEGRLGDYGSIGGIVRGVLLKMYESVGNTICNLILNVQLIDLISYCRLTTEQQNQMHTYQQTLSICHQLTTRIISLTPNIYLTQLSTSSDSNLPTLTSPSLLTILQTNSPTLKKLFKVLQHIQQQLKQIPSRIFIKHTSNEMENIQQKQKQKQNEQTYKKYTVKISSIAYISIFDVIMKILEKLFTQNVSIFDDKKIDNGMGDVDVQSSFKIGDIYQEILTIFKFILTFFRAHQQTYELIMQIFQYIAANNKQLQHSYILLTQQTRVHQNVQLQKVRRVCVNQLGNLILVCRFIMFQCDFQDNKTKSQLKSNVYGKIMELSKTLRTQIYEYIFIHSLTNKPTQSQIPSPQTYLNDIPIIMYIFGSIKQSLLKLKNKVQLYRQKCLSLKYLQHTNDPRQKLRKYRRLKSQQIIRNVIDEDDDMGDRRGNDGIQGQAGLEIVHETKMILLALVQVLENRYLCHINNDLQMINQCESKNREVYEQDFTINVTLSMQVCRMIYIASQSCKNIHSNYKQILSSYPIPQQSINHNLLQLQPRLIVSLWSITDRIKQTYTNHYNSIKSSKLSTTVTSKTLSTLLSLYQSFIEVFAYVTLYHDNNKCFEEEDVKKQMRQNILIIDMDFLLNSETIGQGVSINRGGEKRDRGICLQFTIVGLIGIFSSFSKQFIQFTNTPLLFLRLLQSYIPLPKLLQSYLNQSLIPTNSNINTIPQPIVNRIQTLLKLTKNILQGIYQNNNSMKTLTIKYKFISNCIGFWIFVCNFVQVYAKYGGSGGGNKGEDGDGFLGKMGDVLELLMGIFMGLLDRNRSSQSNINFSLLKRNNKDFDTFITKFLTILSTLTTLKSSQNQPLLPSYPQLSKSHTQTLSKISKTMLEYIFEFNTHKNSFNLIVNPFQISNNNTKDGQQISQCICLVQPYCQIVIGKILGLMGQIRDIQIKKEVINWGVVEEELGFMKVWMSYVRRATLYEHNIGLQYNISQFLKKIHQTPTIPFQNPFLTSPTPLTTLQPLPLQLTLLLQLLKFGLTIIDIKHQSNYCLDNICIVLTELPGIYKYYAKQQRNKNVWLLESRALIQKYIGISGQLLELFYLIWGYCQEDKNDYAAEKTMYFQWFINCSISSSKSNQILTSQQ